MLPELKAIFPLLRQSITFSILFFHQLLLNGITQTPILETISAFKEKILNFIRPSPNSVFDIRNPKGIKLITRLRLGLSHLREHKFKHSFQDTLNLLCNCGHDIESTTHFFFHCPFFINERRTLLSTLHNLIVNYWIVPIMISHKRYVLATHPKLHVIISKLLTHQLIISYRVRDLTNHSIK